MSFTLFSIEMDGYLLSVYIYIFFIDASGIDICLSTDDGGPLSGFECF